MFNSKILLKKLLDSDPGKAQVLIECQLNQVVRRSSLFRYAYMDGFSLVLQGDICHEKSQDRVDFLACCCFDNAQV